MLAATKLSVATKDVFCRGTRIFVATKLLAAPAKDKREQPTDYSKKIHSASSA